MRLWMINHYAVPPTEAGGTRHYSLARALVGKGHEVYIICSNINHWTGQQSPPAPGQSYVQQDIDGVHFIRLSTPAYGHSSIRRMINMLAFAYKIGTKKLAGLPRPDYIIGSSPHPFAARAALKTAESLKVPFILEIRDLWPQTLIDLGKASPNSIPVKLMFKLELYLYQHASAIITLLPGGVQYISGRGVPSEKITWIPNGMDAGLIPAPPPPQPGRALNVMYLGAHGIANGLDTLVQAGLILKEQGWEDRVRIRLIGEGPCKASLQEQARQAGLDNFSFESAVPKSEVYRVLWEADVLVVLVRKSVLYRWGISLNKIFDYLGAGRPVIIGVDALNDPVAESAAGISIPPEDPPALAEAIKKMASLTNVERWELGQKGRSYVEEFYAYTALGDRLEQLLIDLGEKNGPFNKTPD